MKKVLIYLLFFFGLFFAAQSFAAEEKQGIAIIPIDVGMRQASYSIYKSTQDMFAADIVTELQGYNDLIVIDVNTSENVIKQAGLSSTYMQLVKQYKKRYVPDFEKSKIIADTLGVNYIIFVHGGFDMEKSFLKSNWKYRCQWIWASPIKSSAQYNMHAVMFDTKNNRIVLDENISQDIPMENFQEPSPVFGENMGAISKIKKYTKPKAHKLAKKIHQLIYPDKKDKYSEKNTFVERYTPQNNTEEYNSTPAVEINQSEEVNKTRADNYKNWIEQKL